MLLTGKREVRMAQTIYGLPVCRGYGHRVPPHTMWSLAAYVLSVLDAAVTGWSS